MGLRLLLVRSTARRASTSASATSSSSLPGIHFNFLILVVGAYHLRVAGIIIGLPTLRLRGDYIAIVTLAFGEIVGRVAVNGDTITTSATYKLTERPPGDLADRPDRLPCSAQFDRLINLRPCYWCVLASASSCCS